MVRRASTLELLDLLNHDGLQPAKVFVRTSFPALNEEQVWAIRQALKPMTALDVDDLPETGTSAHPPVFGQWRR
jgi:hypothetical protein